MQVRGSSPGPDFHRAVNERDLGVLGDPERWAYSTTLRLPLDPMIPQTASAPSEQLVRVQTRELIATGWNLMAVWTFGPEYVVGQDNISVAALLASGMGQSSVEWQWVFTNGGLTSIDGLVPLLAGDTRGPFANHLLSPMPFANLAGRVQAAGSTTGPAHDVTIDVFLGVSPIVWTGEKRAPGEYYR